MRVGVAGPEAGIRRIGLGEGVVAVDRQPGVQGVVARLGRVEVGGRQVAGRHLARSQALAHLAGGESGEIGAHSPPRMAGTTM